MLIAFGAYSQSTNPFDIPSPDKAQSVSTTVLMDRSFGDDSLGLSTVDIMGRPLAEELVDSVLVSSDPDMPSETPALNPFDIHKGATPPVKDYEVSDIAISIPSGVKPSVDTRVLVLVYTLVMMMILSLAISLDRKRFNTILSASINSNHLKGLYRENATWTNGQSMILYIYFFINTGFLAWYASIKIAGTPMVPLWWILAALIILYLTRHMIMKIISMVYPVGPEVELHNYSISVHNIVLGIVLLPLIPAIEFIPNVSPQVFLWLAGALVLIVYLLRQAKGMMLSLGMRGMDPLYFFIYLCAIEIAPILVLYKMTIGAL